MQESELFIEYEPMLAQLGLRLVEMSHASRSGSEKVIVVVLFEDGQTTVDHCADAYRLIYPRLQLRFGERDLDLEVSTPGLERSFKDMWEFTVFTGKRVRLYDSGRQATVSGIITEVDAKHVVLTDVFIDDDPTLIERLNMNITAIQKAKLEYRWEDNRHGN